MFSLCSERKQPNERAKSIFVTVEGVLYLTLPEANIVRPESKILISINGIPREERSYIQDILFSCIPHGCVGVES